MTFVASTLQGRRGEAGGAVSHEETLVAYPISGDALRGEGTAKTPSPDAEGRVRLRDPGMAIGDAGDPAFTLAAAGPGAVAYSLRRDPGGTGQGHNTNYVTSITLASDPISARELAQPSTKRNGDPGVVQYGASVRRLTPTEAERLQALPDGWTDPDGTAPDSRRYAALGDAVTASVGEWIGLRIQAGVNGRSPT